MPPDAVNRSLTGIGALAVNLTCAFRLSGHRHLSGSPTKAAFLSARNDALANIALIGAGFVTAYTLSVWPDVVADLAIAVMDLDAAHEVWEAAPEEDRAARAATVRSLHLHYFRRP